MYDLILFSRFSCGVGATLKLGRKIMAEHRGVIYQTNRKWVLYNTEHSSGVLDSVNNKLETIVSWVLVLAKKC